MQTTGSLAQTSLAALLETMQAERATGTLSVKNGGESCSLYFLFGHLFHAVGDAAQGEESVVGALGWEDGQFTFDPRAKLPAEETIKSGTADLLAEAERRRREAPVEAGATQRAVDADGGDDAAYRPPALPPAASLPLPPPPPPPAVAPPAPAYAPPPVAAAQPYVPAQQPPNGERRVADTTTQQYRPSPATQQVPATSATGPAVYGNPNAAPLGELYPLPAGKAIYEGLKSAFVDFPKLLRTLDGDKHTGYVRLDGTDFSGVLLLHDGHVLEALYSDGTLHQAIDAFQGLRRRMEAGQGLLDVIELSGETVIALAQLLTARPLFTGLLGRFINFDQLLEYLAEEKVDGSIVVAGGTETGVILLRKGTIHGAYTQSQRELTTTSTSVTALAQERPARIEVKSGADQPPGIDVEAALRTII